MTISVENSLKKLRTSYIDILYDHWWDWDTSIKEVMDGLHNLVVSGKVLYLVNASSYRMDFNLADYEFRVHLIHLHG
jgi:aryl-alcohol dehydrogenase-like predicted oxidoreductase